MHHYPMLQWIKDLFPVARSLTGDGVRETIRYFQAINPDIQIQSFSTGEHVFDWVIPREWNIRDAYIEHESGERYAEFSRHTLHILGYSLPIDKTLSREDLLPHIFTQPDQPDLIPYVTSYYKDRWGFCMAQNDKDALPPGQYRAYIDASLEDGELLVADTTIQGQSQQEIMFSSYFCHPSMANNELSGPAVLNALLKYVKDHYPNPRMSYRFIMSPETIGAIAYMSRHLSQMKDRIVCGYNLSCVGDDRAYSHVQSRLGTNLADKALQTALKEHENVTTYSFLERGSDERQYCAPGIDLPIAGFCRSKYGTYPEYHTSADNLDIVSESGLQGAFDVMKNIIDAFECGLYPKVTVLGEPQLGKRDLYPSISQKGNYTDIRTRMDVIAYSDGRTSIFDIARIINVPLHIVTSELQLLTSHGLIKFI